MDTYFIFGAKTQYYLTYFLAQIVAAIVIGNLPVDSDVPLIYFLPFWDYKVLQAHLCLMSSMLQYHTK